MDGRLLFFVSSLFVAVHAKNDFPNEVIVTSADLVKGKIENIGKIGESYRLYAIASLGADDNIVKQVSISDSKNKNFKLNDLFGKEGVYLSENNTVTGPVTVTDPTVNISTRKRSVANRLTYTIYLVSTKVPALPIVDVATQPDTFFLDSNDYNGKNVRGLTFLSADSSFSLRSFVFTAVAAYVVPRGYDAQATGPQDSIIDLTRENGPSSYVTIFGPIATVLANENGQFKLTFDRAMYDGSMNPGASFSFLSPNWLSLDDQYSTSFTNYYEAFQRITLDDSGRNELLDFSIVASSLKKGEYVSLEVTNEKGEKREWKYEDSDQGAKRDSAIGSQLHLIVNVNSIDSPETYPRFLIKVKSGEVDPTTETVPTTTPTVPTITPTTSLALSTNAIISSVIALLTVIVHP